MPIQKLSVIIPSYNEEKNFGRGVLQDVVAYLEKQSYDWELVLTDDGSTDKTVSLLKDFAKGKSNVKVVENTHGGKGPTVSAGMLAATGDYRIFSDFDQSTPISEVEKFIPFIEDGYEVVIGSRAVQGARRQDEPLHRHLMGKGFNLLVQLIAVPGIYDTQCGFKLFSGKAAEDLFPRLQVYANKGRQDAFTGAFDVELLLLARRFGYSIAEVPVVWHHHETDRVSPVKDSLLMLRDIVKIRWNDVQRRYSE
ncbi:glycosyltransferase family 2 protein [Candidatus Woesebacteria bacterium]|nr:glycosyltransferase family 2 protein [Candidatus Woesebacteria bacterium]MCD8507522.1 glycosyltransferase family 2 protein [Candidatus Woesebacteria bacterium]MCD8527361.1 glycosyltransferase family 2 protein [Candidatus Woesebacteria bacterium]MCD8546108.1 glycosyltransferase family 2 protein [Candidatus Woesebacteria bacterium]